MSNLKIYFRKIIYTKPPVNDTEKSEIIKLDDRRELIIYIARAMGKIEVMKILIGLKKLKGIIFLATITTKPKVEEIIKWTIGKP